MEGQKNKWVAKLTILVSFQKLVSYVLVCSFLLSIHEIANVCPLHISLFPVPVARHTHEYVPCFCPHFRNPVRLTLETTNVLLKISGEMTTPPLPLDRKLTLYLFIYV